MQRHRPETWASIPHQKGIEFDEHGGDRMLCEICHERLKRPGYRTCWTCNGFPEREEEEQPMEEKQAPELGHCATCGADFEPYKNGRVMIRDGLCKPCLMKKKYGPDWIPGGNSKKRLKDQKARIEQLERMLKEKQSAPTAPEPDSDGPPGNHDSAVSVLDGIKADQAEQAIMAKTVSGLLTIRGIKHVTIPFEYPDDEAIYDRIMAVCKKERRTPEAQILYWLDRVVEV